MNGLLAAIVAGFLFGAGTFLLLAREPIKLVLGLSLVSYGTNILLFTASTLSRGLPPIIRDKEAFAGDIKPFVDPTPQALILTAIVISFGITAFLLILINRRNALTATYLAETPPEITEIVNDPFGTQAHFLDGLDADPDDYEWLEDTLEERLLLNRRQNELNNILQNESANDESASAEPAHDESANNKTVNDETGNRNSGNEESRQHDT